MPSQVIALANVKLIYDGIPADGALITVGDGVGSVYTCRAYGTAGQTVEIRGGFPDDAWADMQQIAVLTVGADQSAVTQHAWPVLAVQGAARLKIARGSM